MTSKTTSLRVAFRVDASLEIGTGHVMRCLTLATALRERGADCVFICRELAGHLCQSIIDRGFALHALPQRRGDRDSDVDRTLLHRRANEPQHSHWLGASWQEDVEDTKRALAHHLDRGRLDWLIVDHYALDARWEAPMREQCKQLMVIDDLADRPHECDLLLDQNLGRMPEDYAGLVPSDTPLLLGPKYALLRPEFARLRATSLARRKNPRLEKILVTMGGVDKDNATGRVLDALDAASLPAETTITVVMGPSAPWLDAVRARAAQMRVPTEVRVGVNDMAELMANCDLAIGAGGSTTWERCALGLPTLQIVVAANQIEAARALARAGATLYLPSPTAPDFAWNLEEGLKKLASPRVYMAMSRRAAAITDALGTPHILQTLFEGK